MELSEILKARYLFDKIEYVTLAHVKKAIIGAAVNVREECLRDLFKAIKSFRKGEQECLSYMMAGNHIFENEELLASFQNTDSFEELTSEQLDALLQSFRTLPNNKGLRENIFEVLYPGLTLDQIKENNKEDYLLLHDIDFLDLIDGWQYLYLYHHDLAITEYVGKSWPYKELKVGMVLPFPNKENKASYYRVQDALPHKRDGVRAYLFTPLNKHQDAYKSEESENINLVFRGTDPSTTGIETGVSVIRDLDYQGVGKTSFLDREKEILAMVENYLRTTEKDNITLNISGHSLGGCDTQRALVSILKKIADADEESPYQKVKKIVITTHNSPGIDHETNDRCLQALKKINKDRLSIHINHVSYQDMYYYDWIQKAGNVWLGKGFEGEVDNKFVKRSVTEIKFEENFGFVSGLLPRHSIRAFNKKKCEIPWMIEEYSEGHKDLESKLAGNWHWDRNNQNLRQYASWYLGYAQRPLKALSHNVLDKLFAIGLGAVRLVAAPPPEPRRLM